MLDAVSKVVVVVRSRQSQSLLLEESLMDFLQDTERLEKFVYLSRANELMLSPDFVVEGMGRSAKKTLSKSLDNVWAETEWKAKDGGQNREAESDWKYIESSH